jgi:hypothetical protein
LGKLQVVWNKDLVKSYEKMKVALADSSALRYPSETESVFVFSDASEYGWGSFISLVREEDCKKPVAEMNHVPLAFYSGIFSETQKAWSVLEKEMFAAVITIQRGRYVLHRNKGFTLVVDHQNLREVMASSTHLDVKRMVEEKITRWRLLSQAFSFVIMVIPGVSNLVADLLSRARNIDPQIGRLEEDENFTTPDFAIRLIKVIHSVENPVTEKEIRDSQVLLGAKDGVVWDTKTGIWRKGGKIYIPGDSDCKCVE